MSHTTETLSINVPILVLEMLRQTQTETLHCWYLNPAISWIRIGNWIPIYGTVGYAWKKIDIQWCEWMN